MMRSLGFLVVRIKPDRWRRSLLFVIPLFVLAEAIDAFIALARLTALFGWRPTRRVVGKLRAWGLAHLLEAPSLFLHELRSVGSFTLVDIDDGDTRIFVRIV